MQRRAFLGGSLATLGSLALPAIALGQATRREWSPTGPLDGREPADPSALSAEEHRHVPVLVMPARVRANRPFDLVVQVGVEPHVMNDAHRVEWIEVAVGETRTFIADLGANVAYPIVRFSMTLASSSTITARAYCNQHGVWRTRRQVDVR